MCSGYQGARSAADAELIAHTSGAGLVTRLAVASERSLERQARLAQLLARATPQLEPCEPEAHAVVSHIERLLEQGIDLTSRGPRASDVTQRSARVVEE
jgi:hypothetical protein